jgi:hypothetical protein
MFRSKYVSARDESDGTFDLQERCVSSFLDGDQRAIDGHHIEFLVTPEERPSRRPDRREWRSIDGAADPSVLGD